MSNDLNGTGLTRMRYGIPDPIVHSLNKLTPETKPAVLFQDC
jgi:hypothetical protein